MLIILNFLTIIIFETNNSMYWKKLYKDTRENIYYLMEKKKEKYTKKPLCVRLFFWKTKSFVTVEWESFTFLFLRNFLDKVGALIHSSWIILYFT